VSALEGMRVLVTGASRGIGNAVARTFVEGGARVAMTARGEAALRRAAEEIGGWAIPADASDPASVDRLRDEVHTLLGDAPDVLVNGAGAFVIAAFSETEPDAFAGQLAANVMGPFLVTRAFLPELLRRGSGHIVNVGSIAGRIAFPGNAAYSASKYGLRGMHEVLAAELRGTGVRATLLEPAATDTPIWDPFQPDEREDLPSRESMMRPDDVARAVRYIVTQPAEVEVTHLAIRSAR